MLDANRGLRCAPMPIAHVAGRLNNWDPAIKNMQQLQAALSDGSTRQTASAAMLVTAGITLLIAAGMYLFGG